MARGIRRTLDHTRQRRPPRGLQAGSIYWLWFKKHAGEYVLRPALVLKRIPGQDEYLYCAVSDQRTHNPENRHIEWLMGPGDERLTHGQLNKDSVIKAWWLNNTVGMDLDNHNNYIGTISNALLEDILTALGTFLMPGG